ncbi:hypothetical protein [Streptomyces sp. FIT100]|uniref:hypothetical protein n=1 Tax=Streptomyces sp. FIT100 TaxID=2837956 RepID=UPI0021C73EA6|nr:hypothetical protein [Streptomyces sp. FIT100]UUN26427.1 hypothetical protein KK483_08350 [Streptomyces sp. FIT100]
MAEQHDADRDDRDRDPQPIDEEAAWAAIVAGYGEEPADPPGAKPFKSVEDLAGLSRQVKNDSPPKAGDAPDEDGDRADGDTDGDQDGAGRPGPERPLGSSVVFAPGVGVGVGGGGPRDYEVAEAGEDDLDETDEGHFVPPEPPPLPEADTTAKFAWLAVIGGPVLLLLAVLLQWDMTWWLTTLGVGGFLGGFATLVARMSHGDDEDDDDPGRGAVV